MCDFYLVSGGCKSWRLKNKSNTTRLHTPQQCAVVIVTICGSAQKFIYSTNEFIINWTWKFYARKSAMLFLILKVHQRGKPIFFAINFFYCWAHIPIFTCCETWQIVEIDRVYRVEAILVFTHENLSETILHS